MIVFKADLCLMILTYQVEVADVRTTKLEHFARWLLRGMTRDFSEEKGLHLLQQNEKGPSRGISDETVWGI